MGSSPPIRGRSIPFNLHTQRKSRRSRFPGNLSPALGLRKFSPEKRDGLSGHRRPNSASARELRVVLPNVIDTITDQFNLGFE